MVLEVKYFFVNLNFINSYDVIIKIYVYCCNIIG